MLTPWLTSKSTHLHDGVEDYESEFILDSQMFQGKLEYLVNWKGYRIEDNE